MVHTFIHVISEKDPHFRGVYVLVGNGGTGERDCKQNEQDKYILCQVVTDSKGQTGQSCGCGVGGEGVAAFKGLSYAFLKRLITEMRNGRGRAIQVFLGRAFL